MAPGTPVFSKGSRVVYPNQGVCRVVGEIEMTIGGQSATFLKLSREDDDGTVMIPLDKLAGVGVRRLASEAEIAKLFEQLSAPDLGPDLNWKTRHRSHGERMSEGGVFAMAEVVKELAALADLRPLPTKERELYDNARHLLVSEIAAALGIDEASAEDAVDFALFPPGVERKKLAALALDALASLADEDGGGGALELDEDLLADADSLDGLEADEAGGELLDGDDRDGPLAMDELEGAGAKVAKRSKAPTSKKRASAKKASARPAATSSKAAFGSEPGTPAKVGAAAAQTSDKASKRAEIPEKRAAPGAPSSSRKKKGASPSTAEAGASAVSKLGPAKSKAKKAAPRLSAPISGAAAAPAPSDSAPRKRAPKRTTSKKEKPT